MCSKVRTHTHKCACLTLSLLWLSKALAFAVLRKIVLEIPALFLLNRLFPMVGLAYAQFTAELILSVAAVVVLVRMFRRLEREQAERLKA